MPQPPHNIKSHATTLVGMCIFAFFGSALRAGGALPLNPALSRALGVALSAVQRELCSPRTPFRPIRPPKAMREPITDESRPLPRKIGSSAAATFAAAE